MSTSSLIRQELGFVLLLSIAALVAVASRRSRLPYTVALVLVGLGLSVLPDFPRIEISGDLILALLVPPLVFEGALALPWAELRRNLLPILLLAVVGVGAGALVVATILTHVLGLPAAAALVLGGLMAATDPVAVIALFRSLGVSKRLRVLVEGESLLNDGTSIVLFGLATSPAVIAAISAGSGIPWGAVTAEFLGVSLGGLAVGGLTGYVVSHVVLRGIDDPLIETAVTVALAFGSYVVAESIGASGILAVVAAGLLVGTIGRLNTSPTTRVALDSFWQFMAFSVNSLVFLLIGLQVGLADMPPHLRAIGVAVVAVLVSRFLVVYGLSWLHKRLEPGNAVPMAYRHVMAWGGLRGAISLGLAMTVAPALFGTTLTQDLRVMVFGVVLFTLVVQGTTIAPLIRRLGLADLPAARLEQQRLQARVYAKRAGRRELDRLYQEGLLSQRVWQAMTEVYDAEVMEHDRVLRSHLDAHAELELDVMLQARDAVLRAERGAIAEVARQGLVSEEVHSELLRETDLRSAALDWIHARRMEGLRGMEEAADAQASAADGRDGA